MKLLEKESIPFEIYDEILFSLRHKHIIVTRTIRNYISRNLIATNLELENSKKPNLKQNTVISQMTKTSSLPGIDVFGLFDTNGASRKRKINLSLNENDEDQANNRIVKA